MHQPASLRPQEEVIDQFGISIKYTILLASIGVIIVTATLLVRFMLSDQLNSFSSQLGLLGPLVVNGFVLLLSLVGLYLIGLGLFFRAAYHYYFTTERVIESVGYFSQVTVSAEYKHLTDLIVRQDPISHMILNTGTLAVNTAGGPKEEIVLINIDSPTARREQLRGLAATALSGRKVTRELLRTLKKQTGMTVDNNEPEQSVGDIKPAALPEELPIESPNRPVQPTSRVIIDRDGDGIDEADRLRDAQEHLKP